MPFKFRRRTHNMSSHHVVLLTALLLTILPGTHPQESNNNFCGESWDDASSNCKERQHCPAGTDDECETEGHICFGGTTCDVTKGDGSKFAFANVPYNDISNTRFCGASWDAALEECSVETHCPSGYNDECPGDLSCYGGLGCNVKDLMEELAEEEAAAAAANAQAEARIGKDDPRRNQFCGTSWGSASLSCSTWCPDADDAGCPAGQTCFGETSCYYSDDIVPTQTPTETQSEPPTTRAPSEYKDPANNRFCGKNWGLAVAACSIETSCSSGLDDDCPKGQTCHGGTTCNLIDLLMKADAPDGPTLKPTLPPRNDVSNTQFCGDSWDSADENCSLETHCPDGNCPNGQTCFGGTKCNAQDMTPSPSVSPSVSPTVGPTQRPTGPTTSPTNGPPTTEAPVVPPTISPSISPPPTTPPEPTEHPTVFIPEDDMRHSFWCGTDWNDVVTNCPQPCTSGEDTECPKGSTCFAFTTCRPSPKPIPSPESTPVDTNNPTVEPDTADDSIDEQFNTTEIGDLDGDEESNSPISSPQDTDTSENEYNNTTINTATGGVDAEAAGDSDSDSAIDSNVEVASNADTDATSDADAATDPDTEAAGDTDTDSAIDADAEAASDPDNQAANDANAEPADDTDNETEMTWSENPTIAQETGNPTIPPLASPTASPSAGPVSSPFLEQLLEMTNAPSLVPELTEWIESETDRPTNTAAVTETRSPTVSIETIETESSTPQPSVQESLLGTTIEPSLRPVEEVRTYTVPAPSPQLVEKVGSILIASKRGITSDVLLYTDTQSGAESPTTMYQYDGFLNALSIYSKSLMGQSYFYFGDDTISSVNYGLVNVALFLANAAIETVRFDICDEISWEKDVFGYYPISNACGQGGFTGSSTVSYQDAYLCKEEEEHMACKVDPKMESVAMTKGSWDGSPPPLECFPKTSAKLVTGAWDPSLSCEEDGCDAYDGHVQGNIEPNSIPAANSFGRIDVQGCCWWGRGPFPRGSSGLCKIGKLNHYLGSSSQKPRYDIDFCKAPEAVCEGRFEDDTKNAEVRWILGIQYWIDEVQSYSKDGWSYLDKLHSFVDGGLSDHSIFDAVSTIITRGCHDCGKPISNDDRKAKFDKIISIFGNVQAGVTPAPSLASATETSVPTLSPTLRPSTKLVTNSPIEITNSPITATKTPESNAPIMSTNAPALFAPMIQTNSPASDAPSIRRTYSPVHKTNAPIQMTNAPASNTTITLSTPSAVNVISPEELENRLRFANNYCASSLQFAKDNCWTDIHTCNEGDTPCAMGTACFRNVICTLPGNAAPSPQSEQITTSPTIITSSTNPPSITRAPGNVSINPSNSPSPSSIHYKVPVSCGNICLRPLTKDECEGAGNSIMVFSDCMSVGVGQVCQSLGECGPKALLHNCRGHSVFIRALPDQCKQIITDDANSLDAAAPSTQPSALIINLNDVLAGQTSQYSQQDYGSIENSWWRDVPLGSASGPSFNLSCFFLMSSFVTLLLH